VIAACRGNEGSYPEIAKRFQVGEATVNRWYNRFKRTGQIEPLKMGGRTKPLLNDEDLESIDLLMHDNPAFTVAELIAAFIAEGGPSMHPSTMKRALKKLGYTRKKTPPASRKSRPLA